MRWWWVLEHVPRWLGKALEKVRAGHDKLTLARLDLGSAAAIGLSSPAFAPGGRLPPRFTADGEGVSPPLVWGTVPEGTESLALIVEDPDAPTPRPLVHAVVLDIDPALRGLDEGAIQADAGGEAGKNVGQNSYLTEGWLPPDPPTGHGSHDFVFQLLALGPPENGGGDSSGDSTGDSPGRSEFVEHVEGRILGAGVLVGTYSRGEEAMAGPAASSTARA